MCDKKIKIFLGAFLNVTNAQNINCLAISKYLDKNRFSIYSMKVASYPDIKSNAIMFNCFFPFRISSLIGFLWGVIKCDVMYFPKHHHTPTWALLLSNMLGKKMFTTIESNMCDKSKKRNMITAFGGHSKFLNYFNYFKNIFPISQHILDHANCGVGLNNNIIHLGVDLDNFVPIFREKVKSASKIPSVN